MVESKFPEPTFEQLEAFGKGDPIATQEIVELILPPLVRWAKTKYSGLAADEVESLMHQVLGEICINHERYNPQLSKLTTYILNLFKLRVRGLLQEVNENQKIISLDADPKYEKLFVTPYNYTDDEDQIIAINHFFEQVEERLEPVEMEFLRLMRLGIKDSDQFVSIVVQNRSDVGDIAKEVKNTKERLYRKIRSIATEVNFKFTDIF
jgi:hypothetical protein